MPRSRIASSTSVMTPSSIYNTRIQMRRLKLSLVTGAAVVLPITLMSGNRQRGTLPWRERLGPVCRLLRSAIRSLGLAALLPGSRLNAGGFGVF